MSRDACPLAAQGSFSVFCGPDGTAKFGPLSYEVFLFDVKTLEQSDAVKLVAWALKELEDILFSFEQPAGTAYRPG